MNHSITYEGDWALHGIMSDLGIPFAAAPFHRIGFEIDDAGIQKLADQYPAQIFRTRKWCDHNELTWATLLLRFEDNAFVVALGDGRDFAEVIAPTAAQVNRIHEEIQVGLHGGLKEKTPSFYMLRLDCGEFTADPIDHLPEAVDDQFLELCYGGDILDWINTFRERTIATTGGLTILDGPPGTGKTSLITQMIRRLDATHVFYALPVSQDSALSSPELVPFWQKQNARHADRIKVIVMEDAERLLWRRDGENREAVSSLLNIADGLLGRMLRLHVICSVNARLESLDPAILRPGRLMNHRRFGNLTRQEAEQVAAFQNKIFQPKQLNETYTLAEALNPGVYESPNEKTPIGFKTQPTL